MKQRPKNATEKLCLIAIADCIHSEMDYCWPSVDYLADTTLGSKRNVQYVIKSLTEQGFISIEKIPGRASRYRLVRDNMGQHGSTEDKGGAKSARVQPVAGGGAMGCMGGRKENRPNPLEMGVQHPNKELISNIKETCPLFDTFWNQYPRKESKGKAESAFKKLRKAEKQALLDHLPNRVEKHLSKVEKRYVPLPSTFINQKRWLDEWQPIAEEEQKTSIRRLSDNQLLKLASQKKLSTHGLDREALISKIERAA